MLKSEYEGAIPLENLDIEVAILNNNSKVINETSVKKILYNYKNIVDANKMISYENKKGKNVRGFEQEDFYTLCMDYVINIKARSSSIKLVNKLIDIFSHFGIDDMIKEVAGYTMREKIDQRQALSNITRGEDSGEDLF